MTAHNITMLLGGAPSESTMEEFGVSFVDSYPWDLIYAYACADYFARKSNSCQISESTSSVVLSLFEAHLAAHKTDRNVIAYWFLDDYPGGDVTVLLQKMHNLLAASNNDPTASFARPALCGFGGNIARVIDTDITDSDPRMSYFETALANFSPSYCDMVSLYPYAGNNGGAWPNDPSQFDWSMTYLLPAMFEDLKLRGWDASKEPLVALPQAFGYGNFVAPTGDELATQMEAYCKAGAVALIMYSWHDDYAMAHPSAPVTELFNSADLRTGLAEGFKRCQAYW